MGLTDAAKIVQQVTDREGELQPLFGRFNTDYKRITSYKFEMTQKGGEAGGTYDNYTTNKPKTLINKIVGTLAKAPLHIQLEYDEDTKEGRKAKDNAERFVYGNIDLADTHFKNINLPSFQAQLAYHSTLYGWYAIRAFINLNDKEGEDKGYGIPRLAIWYMGGVSFEMGEDGPAWVCNKKIVPVSQAAAEWGYQGGTKKGTIAILDYWNDEHNMVIIDGKFVKTPQKGIHQLGHVPVIIVAAGSAPPMQSTTETDLIKYQGEGALAPNRESYDQFEHQMTYRSTIVAEGVHAPLGAYSKDGKMPFKRSPYGKARVTQLSTNNDEDIKPLSTPSMPQDADAQLAVINDEITMGGASDILSGIDSPGGSAKRAGLLGHYAAQALLSAPQEAMERGIEWMGRELLSQYSEGSFTGLKLRGRDWGKNRFKVDLKPSDVKGDWFPDASLHPDIPIDKHQLKMDAIQLVVAKLLSKESVRDTDLGIRDADLEQQKIDREEAMDFMPVKIRRWAAAILKDGGEENKELAMMILDEIERMKQPQTPSLPHPDLLRVILRLKREVWSNARCTVEVSRRNWRYTRATAETTQEL